MPFAFIGLMVKAGLGFCFVITRRLSMGVWIWVPKFRVLRNIPQETRKKAGVSAVKQNNEQLFKLMARFNQRLNMRECLPSNVRLQTHIQNSCGNASIRMHEQHK